MKKIKDKKIIVLAAILFIFTIFYFTMANQVSYAFETDYDSGKSYNGRIETIIKCAEAYGNAKIEEFNEEGLLYINVQTLIDEGILIPDEEGNVVNTLTNEPLNNKKIRLKYADEAISAELYD